MLGCAASALGASLPALAADAEPRFYVLSAHTGAVLDRAQSLAAAKDARSNGVVNRLEDVQVRLFENRFGIVSGVNAASSPAGSARLRFTDVFVLRDGRWQAVSAQETLEVPQHPHSALPPHHPHT